MPTYEYACKRCAEHLEVVQSFKDDALTECPNCGGALRKVFGSVGIVFKGSGFYKNDSRPAGGRSETKSEPAKTETKADTKPDSKSEPAKKSETKSDTKSDTKKSEKTAAAS